MIHMCVQKSPRKEISPSGKGIRTHSGDEALRQRHDDVRLLGVDTLRPCRTGSGDGDASEGADWGVHRELSEDASSSSSSTS